MLKLHAPAVLLETQPSTGHCADGLGPDAGVTGQQPGKVSATEHIVGAGEVLKVVVALAYLGGVGCRRI